MKFTAEQIEELYKKALWYNLEGVDFLAGLTNDEIADSFNGIGPEFAPEILRSKFTEVFEIFLPCAMIHDVRTEYSDGTRKSFCYANEEFRRNCIKVAKGNYNFFSWKRYRAMMVAEVLYCFVSSDRFGWKAWLDAQERHMAKEALKKISGNGAGETREVI